MPTNAKTYEKKINGIKKSIINDRKIVEAISKGGELEIKIKEKCIEFWRKEKGKKKELVSELKKISNEIRYLRVYSNTVLDLINNYWHSDSDYKDPDYKASLTVKYINTHNN